MDDNGIEEVSEEYDNFSEGEGAPPIEAGSAKRRILALAVIGALVVFVLSSAVLYNHEP